MKPLCLLLLSAAAGFSLTGVFKPTLNFTESSWNSTFTARFMERRNLNFARFETAWAVSPSVGDPAASGPDNNYSDYRIVDFEPEIAEGESFSILQNLDRLNLQFRPGGLRVTAGRQAIYWGVSKSVSPTDFIAPYSYGTIDTEYRVGVDALRAVYPTGMLSEIEAGTVLGKSGENSGYWARGRFYAINTDLTVLGAAFSGTLLAGGSLNRAIGGAVGWVEGAWSRHDSGVNWWNLSTGAEKSFMQSSLYCFGEYHYNSAGVVETEDYIAVTATEAYRNGTIYLLGKHYSAVGTVFTASPLLILSAGGLINMNDMSSRFSIEGEYSLSDNSSLVSGMSAGTGSAGDEFGHIPFSFFSRYSFYF